MRGVKPVCSAVLARLANDTCTAHKQHLCGSRAMLVFQSDIVYWALWHCLSDCPTLFVVCHRIASCFFGGRMVVSVCKEALDGRKVKLSDANYGL